MRYLYSFLLLLICCSASEAQTRTLENYLQTAIHSSPLIKDLNNRILAARLDSIRIKAGFLPQVSAGADGLYAPVIHGYGYAQPITNGQVLDVLLRVNKAFIGKNYLNAQLAEILFQKDSLRNSIKLSEQDLRKAITAQYIAAYGSLEQSQFNQEVVALLSKEESLLKKLTRNNVYRQSDYLAFLVTLKQAQLQLAQSRMQYKNDYATLNYLSGISDTTMSSISKPDLAQRYFSDRRQSIFFRQFTLDSLRIKNQHQLIDYSYKPRLRIFADGGYNSDLLAGYYKNFGASIGFGVTIPIYDGGLRKLAHRKLMLEEDTRRNYRDFFDKQYDQQINQLRQQISGYDRLLADIQEQFKYSESLIKVDTQLLQTGDLRIGDLILAVNGYLSVKNLLTQNTVSQLQLINQLNYWNK